MLVNVMCPYCKNTTKYDETQEYMFCPSCGGRITFDSKPECDEQMIKSNMPITTQDQVEKPNLIISYNTTNSAIGMVTRIVSTGVKNQYGNGQSISFHLNPGQQQIILKIGAKNYARDIVIPKDNTLVRVYASFNGRAQISIDQPKVFDIESNDQIAQQSASLIVPESLYLATYIAISDNRLFDREWFRIENTIKERDFDDDVRNNVLNIILDRPEKITLDQTLEALADKPIEIRNAALRLGLEIAYSDRAFGERESVIFQSLRTKLHIDRKTYAILCSEAQAAVADKLSDNNGEKIIIHAKSLYERYENCLFSADVYSDVVKEMSVIAKEDIAYASKKVEKMAQMYRVYPQMLKKQTENAINYQSHLNDKEQKKQLEEFFKQLLDSIDQSLERSDESMNVLRERQAAASDSFTISFMGRTKAGKSTLHSVLLGGLNNDFIGRGSERTTRYNFIYDYKARKDIEKFCHVATMEEIEANDFNLNIPRYVDTSEKEEEINLAAKAEDIEKLNAEIKSAETELKKYFDELGLKFPF